MRSLIKHSVLSTLTLFAFACGGEEVNDAQPVISSFTISKDNVSAGEKVTLTWATVDADVIEITEGTSSTPFFTGSDGSGSTESPAIDEAVSYTLVAKNSASGKEAIATVEVLSVGGIRIASFTATPMNAEEDAEITLAWEIGGEQPTEVKVVDSDGAELFKDDSPENTGSFDLVPVPEADNTATYRLQVRGPSGRPEASVTVNINVIVDEPVIVDFFAASTDVAKGDRAQITWEVSNTTEVQVSLNGTIARPYTDVGVPNGNTRITVNDAMNVFKLEARSEDGVVVSQEITVRGLDVPVIESLEITPVAYTQASTVATVTWTTSSADSTNLQVNGRDVSGFPRDQLSGTFNFNVTGAAAVTFVATNPVRDTAQTVNIELGFDEPEPNDNAGQAMPIAADGVPVRGTVSMIDDTDWYTFIVPEGAYVYAQAGYDAVSGCSFDSILRLYDADGTTELGFEDNTTAPDISPCAEINPLASNYAARLPAGTYYLSVGGSGVNSTGQYSLTVRVLMPVPDIPGRMAALKIGNPPWDIGDFVQFSAELDGAAMNPFSVGLNPLFSPMHSPTGGTGVGVLMGTDLPHQPDYGTELQMGMNMRGQASGSDFPVAQIIEPLGMYVGFTLQPSSTATVAGRTVDFVSGPILPRSLYPFSVEVDFEVNGMVIPDLNTQYLIDFAGAAGLDGGSHEHVFAAVRAGAGADPAMLLGDYNWEYTLLDANNDGYTFAVPFTLR